MEFVFENAALYWGATMGYGNPKTLSDSSVRNCNGDIKEFKPSILVGVPAVWETVKKGIITKVNAGSPVVRGLFWGALWAKNNLMGMGLPGSGLLDAVVFKKLKEATGGRLKLCMNGGGPVAKDTQRFISMAIAPMIIGYGLTETTAMGTLQNPLEWTVDSIGCMPASVECKLVDFPDAGYFATNKPHPQGEVWLRGPTVMSGYYQNDKETAEAISSDGWFKTGDIGEFDGAGHLKLIDRKKNLIKTLNGEYIALEKLESVYRAAHVVANICVYADDNKAKPIAIIVPAEPALKKLAASIAVPDGSIEELVHNKKLIAAVLKELQAAGRQGGLSGIEIIDGVVLSDEEWTPQNVSLLRAMDNPPPPLPPLKNHVESREMTEKADRCAETEPRDGCPEAEPQGNPCQIPEGSRRSVRLERLSTGMRGLGERRKDFFSAGFSCTKKLLLCCERPTTRRRFHGGSGEGRGTTERMDSPDVGLAWLAWVFFCGTRIMKTERHSFADGVRPRSSV